MNSPQRRSSARLATSALRSELGRLRRALQDLVGDRGPGLRPALVPIPLGGGYVRPADGPTAAPGLQLAFGRRKDGKSQDDGEAGDDEGLDDPSDEGAEIDPDADQLPPIPSALGATELNADPDETPTTEPAVGSWAPVASTAEGHPESEVGSEPGGETLPEADLPAWGARPFSAPEAGATSEAALGDEEPAPWGTASAADDDPVTFSPSVVDPDGEGPENLAWLQSGPGEAAPWGVSAESPAGGEAMPDDGLSSSSTDLEEIEEIQPEAPVEEVLGGGAQGLDSLSEVLTVSDQPWAAPTPALEETVIYRTPPPIDLEPAVAVEASLRTRSFPLPEGEVVFRNLRAGFTDPSRLLRHLAGEGHTGVLHVLGVDGGNSYVVLVDGYVVAVASDREGTIVTTNRIAFPNFPNSQDAINVISYSRQIARGLGLVLHAPVRFEGLGAMFVNLEGLRSYLSKYSSSGGLIVHAQDGIGVALFEDGKLVGAYANGNAPTTDLAQLRELVKDLEAEIDVRFGGPKELAPIPLDTLLSGYPL